MLFNLHLLLLDFQSAVVAVEILPDQVNQHSLEKNFSKNISIFLVNTILMNLPYAIMDLSTR